MEDPSGRKPGGCPRFLRARDDFTFLAIAEESSLCASIALARIGAHAPFPPDAIKLVCPADNLHPVDNLQSTRGALPACAGAGSI
jgi:hypothetical protein